MSAAVWPYHRAECNRPGCSWVGDLHLSPVAAGDDAAAHNLEHALLDDLEVAKLSFELIQNRPAR